MPNADEWLLTDLCPMTSNFGLWKMVSDFTQTHAHRDDSVSVISLLWYKSERLAPIFVK